MTDHHDLPFDEIVALAEVQIRKGATVWFKFTCPNCGTRQTSDTPNTIHTEGYTCEACAHVVFPEVFGLLLMFGTPDAIKEVQRIIKES